MTLFRTLSGTALVLALSSFNSAYAVINPTAATVSLRMTCTENGAALNNCFTTIESLTSWMAATRRPNAAKPLRVEVGAGRFSTMNVANLDITCNSAQNYTGYTSFVGAGPAQTVIYLPQSKVQIASCTGMNFSELGIEGGQEGGTYGGAIKWSGGGNSSWNHVAVSGFGILWYEGQCGLSRGSHYWTASRLTLTVSTTSQAITYGASCDESWFFGSEITVSVPANATILSNGVAFGGAVQARDNGIIHVYGSVIRALVDKPVSTDPSFGFSAVDAGTSAAGGEIHIHGTGIDLISTTGQNIVALKAGPGGHIHANETAYNVQTTGTVTRILDLSGTGHAVHAPYLWQNHPEAPVIVSADGADMAVVTNTLDGKPHLVIYSNSCGSRWFDTFTRECR